MHVPRLCTLDIPARSKRIFPPNDYRTWHGEGAQFLSPSDGLHSTQTNFVILAVDTVSASLSLCTLRPSSRPVRSDKTPTPGHARCR